MNVVRFGNNNQNVIDDISNCVPKTVQLQDLFDTYPNGVRHGATFLIGSLEGEPGRSLSLNIDMRSPSFMKGQDWATNDGVGGIAKILMAGRKWTLKEVIQHYAEYLPESVTGERFVAPPQNPVQPIQQVEQVVEKAPEKKVYNLSTPFDEEYFYTDADGSVICVVRKYTESDEHGEVITDSSGKPKKQFRQFTDGRMGLPEPRPLFNIPDILEADTVVWVEGEKCAMALKQMGYATTCTIGGAGMLSERSASKFDFSPLKNKDVILWPDNDKAGKDLVKLVERLAKLAGARSTLVLTPPADAPEKWDAADAIDDGLDIDKFISSQQSRVKKSISLLDDSLLVSNLFNGPAPEQKFLISDTIPLGVPVLFAAPGDTGKGMMTLDMGLKISSGDPMQECFGSMVSGSGDVVIISAEDDMAEMHRRIVRLDPENTRAAARYQMRVLPLPNLGGVFPVMQKIDNSYEMGEEFARLYEQILQIKNLKLLVIDPLASFVHADVNADPAAGAALMGMLAQMATETGATVMVNHHMAKNRDMDGIVTPEQARNSIRGTTALVDGVRCAIAAWPVDDIAARERSKVMGIRHERNMHIDFAVVKSNGPVDRRIRHLVRDMRSGLPVDRSSEMTANLSPDGRTIEMHEKLTMVLEIITYAENNGIALTITGANGILTYCRGVPGPERLGSMAFIANNEPSDSTLSEWVGQLIAEGKVGKYQLTRTGQRKYLGRSNGPMSRGEFEAVHASSQPTA